MASLKTRVFQGKSCVLVSTIEANSASDPPEGTTNNTLVRGSSPSGSWIFGDLHSEWGYGDLADDHIAICKRCLGGEFEFDAASMQGVSR